MPTILTQPLRRLTPTQYGKRLRYIETSDTFATASFEDDSTEAANLIIGAEGARSTVRNILLGPEKAALKISPIVASTCLPKFSAEAAEKLDEKHPRFSMALHPSGIHTWTCGETMINNHIRYLADTIPTAHARYNDTKPGEGIYMIVMSWLSDGDAEALQGPTILADMKERASKYADPWKQAMLSIPDNTVCWHNRLTYWPTEPWDNRNGTVTLAGDAAHPMTFRTSFTPSIPNFPLEDLLTNPHPPPLRPWPRPQQRHRRRRPAHPAAPPHNHRPRLLLPFRSRSRRRHLSLRRRGTTTRQEGRAVLAGE